MNEEELKKMWKSNEDKLEEVRVLNLQAWALNLQSKEMIETHKSKSQLTSVIVNRIIEIIFLIPFMYLWFSLFLKYLPDIPVAVSSGILVVFSLAALINCVTQIVIVTQIKYSDSITNIQKKLSRLQSHIIEYLRISILFIPLYMVYAIIGFKVFGNVDIMMFADQDWMKFHFINILILIPITIWLYRQVSYKNIHKRWVRSLIEGVGGKSVANAMKFMNEIDEFKKDKVA